MKVREMLKNYLRTLKNRWEKSPFYSKSKYGRWGKFWVISVKSWSCRLWSRNPGL
jgi:hypothetical protein